ncbi:adenosylhomocysteinase [Bifidobacterium phasiani]|nr:adenosylhomocysteinase [Bifidobacterium phasiani]
MSTMTRDDGRRRFAAWAAAVSQRTNRSLAGCRLTVANGIPGCADGDDGRMDDAARYDAQGDAAARNDAQDEGLAGFVDAAAQWGMVVRPDADDRALDPAAPLDGMFDSRRASGLAAMDYAQAHMPVTARLIGELSASGRLAGARIAVCLILEPKTAVLLRLLRAAGATVGVFCEPESTDQRVAEQLRREGVVVEADAGWSAGESRRGALRLLDEIRPQIIIDDGASFARLAAMERPELLDDLIGVAEETTSGVRAFQAMQDAGALTFPVIAVNDSVLKTGFDNMHGTGETCVTTMQRILGAQAFDGARVAVIGYGPVGRGFATRVRALGARVAVCDTDPVAALRAVFDGFAALDVDDALPGADIVVSATGVRHTVTIGHMRRMREGAVLAVIGGIANEIALDEIPGFRAETGRDAVALPVPGGPTLTLLADGDGVNYTVGGGNPIEIMDLSFAVQACAVAHLLETRGALAPGLHRLDAAADRRIATAALAVRGFGASHADGDNGYDWTMTRFADGHGGTAASTDATDTTDTSGTSRTTAKEARR